MRQLLRGEEVGCSLAGTRQAGRGDAVTASGGREVWEEARLWRPRCCPVAEEDSPAGVRWRRLEIVEAAGRERGVTEFLFQARQLRGGEWEGRGRSFSQGAGHDGSEGGDRTRAQSGSELVECQGGGWHRTACTRRGGRG